MGSFVIKNSLRLSDGRGFLKASFFQSTPTKSPFNGESHLRDKCVRTLKVKRQMVVPHGKRLRRNCCAPSGCLFAIPRWQCGLFSIKIMPVMKKGLVIKIYTPCALHAMSLRRFGGRRNLRFSVLS